MINSVKRIFPCSASDSDALPSVVLASTSRARRRGEFRRTVTWNESRRRKIRLDQISEIAKQLGHRLPGF
jgi:hypothetical protein